MWSRDLVNARQISSDETKNGTLLTEPSSWGTYHAQNIGKLDKIDKTLENAQNKCKLQKTYYHQRPKCKIIKETI